MIGGGHQREWRPGIHPWPFSTVNGCDNFDGRRIASDMASLSRAFFVWFRWWGRRVAQGYGGPGYLRVFPRYLTIRRNQGTWAPLRPLGSGSRWRSAEMPKRLMRGCAGGRARCPAVAGAGPRRPWGRPGGDAEPACTSGSLPVSQVQNEHEAQSAVQLLHAIATWRELLHSMSWPGWGCRAPRGHRSGSL